MTSKQKILIVDDDNNIAELISLYLTKECFETKIVNDGEQALREFDSFHPDLLLLDLMLPESTDIRCAENCVIPQMFPLSCSLQRVKLLTRFWGLNWEQMITLLNPLMQKNW